MDQAESGSLATSHRTDSKMRLKNHSRLLIHLFPPVLPPVHRVERTTHRRKRQEPRSGPAPSRSATRFLQLLYKSYSYTLINSTLRTRLYNLHIYRAKDPSASTATRSASTGQLLDFFAIATIGAAMGH